MKSERFLSVLILISAIAFLAYLRGAAENTNVSLANSSTLAASETQIEKVDFKNFTYSYSMPQGEMRVTLTDGKNPFGKMKDIAYTLDKVDYVDLTADGANEAIVNLSVENVVTPYNLIYIYTMDKGEPKAIWTFWTGSKAEGGLKKVSAQNGELIVELFGDAKLKAGEVDLSSAKGNSHLPAKIFTKVRFKWNGEKFALEGKPELFDYDWKAESKKRAEN